MNPNEEKKDVEAPAEADKEVKTFLDEVTGEQVSKNELKKRQKKREADAKKAKKEAEKAEKQKD